MNITEGYRPEDDDTETTIVLKEQLGDLSICGDLAECYYGIIHQFPSGTVMLDPNCDQRLHKVIHCMKELQAVCFDIVGSKIDIEIVNQ